MKNKLFSKEFWSKKRIIGVSAAGGIAIVAVAVAVPVALTTKTGTSGTANENGGDPGEQIQITTMDRTADTDYTRDVAYGTSLEELAKLAPELPGHESEGLYAKETNYSDTRDAGTPGTVAAFSYKPLGSSESMNSRVVLKVGIEIQKAYLGELDNYSYTVPEVKDLIGVKDEWNLYDVSSIQLPNGLSLNKENVKYYVDATDREVIASSVSSQDSGTVLRFSYEVVPDNNHYGNKGAINVKYKFQAKDYGEIKPTVLPLIGLKKGEPQPNITLIEKAGYNSLTSSSRFDESIGVPNIVQWFYYPQSGNANIRTSVYTTTMPYVYYQEKFADVLQDFSISITKYYGTNIEFSSPEIVPGFEGWSEPSYALTKVVKADANNYLAEYGDKSNAIGFDDIPKIPANSAFSVTYTTRSETEQKNLKYTINVSVEKMRTRLPSKHEEVVKTATFSDPISISTDTKPNEILGTNATFDVTQPVWRVSKEGVGNLGSFVKGYSLNSKQLTPVAPAGTVLVAQLTAVTYSDNFLGGYVSQDLFIGYKIGEAAADQKISVKYGQIIEAVTALAKAKITTPNDRNEPELLTEFTTYKNTLVPGQISYVVLKYDSKTAGLDPLYKTYQVEVQKQTEANFAQLTIPSLSLTSGEVPRKLTENDTDLPDGWLLSDADPEYYVQVSGQGQLLIGDITAKIKSLSNHEVLVANYKITADPSRYEPATSRYLVRYTVQLPAPAEIIYKEQVPAFADFKDKKWEAKQAPEAPSGLTYVRSHYSYLGLGDSAGTQGSDSDQEELADKIVSNTGYYHMEVVWTYKNQQGQWLWIVAPYLLAETSQTYYQIQNKLKASPATGTKVSFFGQVAKVTVDSTGVLLSNRVADQKTQLDASGNSFTVDLPAGSVIEVEYKKSGETNALKTKLTVGPKLIEGKPREGRKKQVKFGQDFAPTPSRVPPANFGQKDNTKQDGNKSEYAFGFLQITGLIAPLTGIYHVGLKVNTSAEAFALVKNLPIGATFIITWTASELNDNYVASPKQILVDTYTVIN